MKLSHLFVLFIMALVVLFKLDFQLELMISDNDGTKAKKHFRSQFCHQESKLVLRDFWKRLFHQIQSITKPS